MYQEASNANLMMLLYTAVVPFMVSLAIGYLTSKWLKRGTYLGYLAGFFVGLGLIHTGLSLPPKQAIDYLSASVLIGLIGHIITQHYASSKHLLGIVYLLIALSFYWLLNPVLKHSGLTMSLIWVVVCTTLSVLYLQLEAKASRQTRLNTPLVAILPYTALMIITASSAPVVAIGGSLLLAQLLGVLAAALCAYCLLALAYKQTALSPLGAWLIYAGLMAQSHVLADIAIGVVALSVLSSLFMPLAMLALQHKLSQSRALVLLGGQVMLSAVLTGVSLYLVWPASSLY